MSEAAGMSVGAPWPRRSALFGRDSECAAVDRLIATVRAGQGAVLVIVGEPGIGKSSLLVCGVERAGDDVRMLSARGVRAEEDVPFDRINRFEDTVNRTIEQIGSDDAIGDSIAENGQAPGQGWKIVGQLVSGVVGEWLNS